MNSANELAPKGLLVVTRKVVVTVGNPSTGVNESMRSGKTANQA